MKRMDDKSIKNIHGRFGMHNQGDGMKCGVRGDSKMQYPKLA